MNVRYIGAETASKPGSGETYGFKRKWKCGEVIELDADYVAEFGVRIARHPFFEVVSDSSILGRLGNEPAAAQPIPPASVSAVVGDVPPPPISEAKDPVPVQRATRKRRG